MNDILLITDAPLEVKQRDTAQSAQMLYWDSVTYSVRSSEHLLGGFHHGHPPQT